MVQITLDSERIRTAPIEVRRWIENEVTSSLGLPIPEAVQTQVHHDHLVACTRDEIVGLLDLIGGMPPVLSVFFELGRAGSRVLPGNVEMGHLAEVANHTRLRSASQVIACLKIINQAYQELRGDPSALLCAVDEEDRYFIAPDTRASIHDLWQTFIARQAAHQFFPNATLAPRKTELSCAPPYAVEVPKAEVKADATADVKPVAKSASQG